MSLELNDVSPLVEKCIYDEPAPCSNVCPFSVDIRKIMKKAAKGRLPAAYRDLRTSTVFPSVAIKFCDRSCMKKCQRLLLGDEAVDISAIEKAIVKIAGHQTPDVFQIPKKETAVAVIGAGPSGLALALAMAQKKYPVTVFDENEGWGGSLRNDPDFSSFDEDFSVQFSMEEVEFKFGNRVSSLEELTEYSAVYIATGKNGETFGLIDSLDKQTYCTERRATFIGGEAAGIGMLQGIAISGEVSRIMEGAIQTGRPAGATAKSVCLGDCNLIPDGAEKAAHVAPNDSESGYDKAEVKAEASRCLLCNCDKCLNSCELMNKYKKPPKQCAMEVVADNGPHFLASRTMTREVYGCNECGYCKSICPGSVNMGDIYSLSRFARVDEGIVPEAFHDFWLRELDFKMNEAYYAFSSDGGKVERVFFPGCRLSDSLTGHVVKAFNSLNSAKPTGIILGCCGAPAVWAGDRSKMQSVREKLISVWEEFGKPEFITACTSCDKMLSSVAPEIKTVSLYELDEFRSSNTTEIMERACVFDPCSARENRDIQKAIREIAAASGTSLEEIKDKGKCCGYGGHMRAASPKLYNTIKKKRASDNELPYIVYCANCREVFRSEGKECSHILELIYGRSDTSYSISEKKANLLALKSELMNELEGKKFMPTVNEWDDIKIVVNDELRNELEECLMSDDDIKECIFNSVSSGERFIDENNVYVSSLMRRVMTYWVEYKETDDGSYIVTNAYCHRMSFDEGVD